MQGDVPGLVFAIAMVFVFVVVMSLVSVAVAVFALVTVILVAVLSVVVVLALVSRAVDYGRISCMARALVSGVWGSRVAVHTRGTRMAIAGAGLSALRTCA
jgi:hypothetical protein